MRIVVAADIHYHDRWRRALERLARQVRDERPDCFILAGDIGHPLRSFARGLGLFSGLDCPRLALPGNHDLWSGENSSEALWGHLLAEAARQAGYTWLESETVRLGGLGICGTLGWYDYSARDPNLVLDDQDYFINKGMFNNDGNYIDWERSDQAFAAEVLEGFGGRLRSLCQDPEVSQVVVVTHVPPFEENMVRKEGNLAWSIGNAYFGNLTLGRAIVACPKVSHVISGHTHVGGRWQIATPHGSVESIVVGSDYGWPAYVVLELPWIAHF